MAGPEEREGKMEKTAPLVITISRQLGAGGAYVGKQLAENLSVFYADREIIDEAAKELSVLKEDLESHDEKISSFLRSFLLSHAIPPVANIPRPISGLSDIKLFKIQSEIIARIAKERSAVIIGRCGSYVLREHPNHVSIFLHADMTFRQGRMQKLHDVSEGEAREMITRSDGEREQYHYKFTGKDWTDARQYDISMDTGKIGVDKCVECIMKYLDLIQ